MTPTANNDTSIEPQAKATTIVSAPSPSPLLGKVLATVDSVTTTPVIVMIYLLPATLLLIPLTLLVAAHLTGL